MGCVPSEVARWTADPTCGVFVSATGNDDSNGSPDAPVKTLTKAIERAAESKDKAARRVYACAQTFSESLTVTVTAGVTLYGGLDCDANWQWREAKKTILTAAPGIVPLAMRAEGETVRLEDLHVIAPSINPDDAGTSAIAAIAERCTIDLVRCTFEAGNAAPGASGEASPLAPLRPPNGTRGNDACSADDVFTAAPLLNDCGTADTADDSIGGRGGNGFVNRGSDGGSGSPGAEGHLNAGTYVATGGTCTSGDPGSDGDPGAPGAGARGIGQLSSDGYTGSSGSDGERGKTAQGGGGGGGTRGSTECPGPTDGGASGGNGGAGGCGGAGGMGGSPGGSSIALVSINATLTFRGLRLIAGQGGRGGDGAAGQDGGPGAYGGPGGTGRTFDDNNFVRNACDGGRGGLGGNGGRGGGGQGGHSVGIAFLGTPGTAPSLEDVMSLQLGAPGEGGRGSDAGHNGDAGQASGLLDFSPPQRAPAP
ncbi:hypothetical protein ACSRUE_40320 [Sorangium sp. KYC3313]|uniref:hypothetical protein n=1 Tax=Sorangium sp. KYC3313 TaxID=3449740 RepID=UPI003F8C6A25